MDGGRRGAPCRSWPSRESAGPSRSARHSSMLDLQGLGPAEGAAGLPGVGREGPEPAALLQLHSRPERQGDDRGRRSPRPRDEGDGHPRAAPGPDDSDDRRCCSARRFSSEGRNRSSTRCDECSAGEADGAARLRMEARPSSGRPVTGTRIGRPASPARTAVGRSVPSA